MPPRLPLMRDASRRGRLRIAGLALLIGYAALVAAPAFAADDPKAREIMTAVDEREDGDNQTSNMQMVLIDKRGKQRVRELRSFRKDKGIDEQSMMFFLSPADVEDTGFLTYDYDDADRDDDQWLYLPALKKTKRIAGGDKSGSFMGSDFTYADLASRPLDRYQYTLMKETDVAGVPVWQVESIPNEKESDETGYTKSIVFVRQDNHMVIRSVNWVKKGKKLKYFEVKKLEQIDGIWVATELTMTTRKGKATVHRTRLEMSNVRFDQDHDEQLFTVRQLEKGL